MAKTADKKKDNVAVAQKVQEEGTTGMEIKAPAPNQGEDAETAGNGGEESGADAGGKEAETKEEAEGTAAPETEKNGNGDASKKVLAARTYILYGSHQYKPGEILPANNPDMVEAWLDAKTAAWVPVQDQPVKASPVSAVPGLAGTVLGAAQMGALAGKVSMGADGK